MVDRMVDESLCPSFVKVNMTGNPLRFNFSGNHKAFIDDGSNQISSSAPSISQFLNHFFTHHINAVLLRRNHRPHRFQVLQHSFKGKLLLHLHLLRLPFRSYSHALERKRHRSVAFQYIFLDFLIPIRQRRFRQSIHRSIERLVQRYVVISPHRDDSAGFPEKTSGDGVEFRQIEPVYGFGGND